MNEYEKTAIQENISTILALIDERQASYDESLQDSAKIVLDGFTFEPMVKKHIKLIYKAVFEEIEQPMSGGFLQMKRQLFEMTANKNGDKPTGWRYFLFWIGRYR